MRVGVLGPLEVVADDGAAIAVGGARLRLLLTRLAVDAGRTVSADALTDALWPDGGPSDQANALQSLVSRLRQALPRPADPDRAAVRLVPGGYRLDLAPEDVDALRFERLARAGRRALNDGQPQVAAAQLREALGLWRGEPLADAAAAQFATPVVARLSELLLAATEDRADAELRAGADPADLVIELEALTAAHPLRERPRILLVRALHASGRQAEALTAYEDFRTRLADALGTDPGPELQAAHLAVLRGEQAPQPAPASGGRPRSNLRAALTAFVGREQERARIREQLEDGRLVTLVGPGGAGKTRLATTVAGGLADRFAGGVWLVELASVTDPGAVAQAVVSALGLRETGLPDAPAAPRDEVTRLIEALSTTETLLILDNCEHLVDAAARLAGELLGRCPRLRILATSREPLGILGETLCPVPPLDVPAPDTAAQQAVTTPSVRLFTDRARAVRPDFVVTDDNVRAVTEVCRRLDGLPLAIELAAARLRVLPVEALAARLDDRFKLLTGGNRTALPRHRTLHAVVAWSWDLLDERERGLAERLAVFPGTITPEAAAHVGGLGPSGSTAVLDTLSALADKSLLQVVDGATPRHPSGQPARESSDTVTFRMLETIREYGLERLAETGTAEIARTRAAHAAWFLQLAETAEPHLRGSGQLPWIDRLATERDNLLAGLRFACDTGDADTAVRLGAALSLFWTIRGSHGEAEAWLRRVLQLSEGQPTAALEREDALAEARTVATVFYLVNAVLSGRYERAKDLAAQLRAGIGSPDGAAGHPAAALLDTALALVVDDAAAPPAAVGRQPPPSVVPHEDPSEDPWARAMLWLLRSMAYVNDADIDGMGGDLTAAVEAFREAGERWGLATSLSYLAYAWTTLGRFGDAVTALEEAIRLLTELDPTDPAVLQRVTLATALANAGDVDAARAELLKLVASGTGTPPAGSFVYARIILADLARHDGDLEEAARQHDAALAELGNRPSADPPFGAMLAASRAHLATAGGGHAAAQEHLAEAVDLVAEVPDPPIEATAAVAIAHLRLVEGNPVTAAELLGTAHALRGAPDTFDVDVGRLTRELRAELGDSAYQAAYDQGRNLERGAALELVREQVQSRSAHP